MALKDAETFLLFSIQMALCKKLDNKDTHRHLGTKSGSKSSEIKCGLIYHPTRMKHWTVLRHKLFLKLMKTRRPGKNKK